MADFVRCMHSKDSQMIALYRKTPIFKKIVGRLTPPLLFLFGVPSRNRRLSAAGWGRDYPAGGLGGKAGPHTSTVIGNVTAAAASRVDTPEITGVGAIRGTKPPPHRRGHGGMIIGYSTITGFVVIILCLIILFIAICIASCSEHFKFSKQEQVIGGGRYISLNIAATVGGIIGVLGHGLPNTVFLMCEAFQPPLFV